MDPRVKQLGKEVMTAASVELDGREATDAQKLALIATAALSQLEALLAADESNEDAQRDIKRARKHLTAMLPPPVESNPALEAKGLDLGQYAHTEIFDGEVKKAEKFARLMGGGKVGEHKTAHHTYAAPKEVLHKIGDDVEAQFNEALHHKGKRGLGC